MSSVKIMFRLVNYACRLYHNINICYFFSVCKRFPKRERINRKDENKKKMLFVVSLFSTRRPGEPGAGGFGLKVLLNGRWAAAGDLEKVPALLRAAAHGHRLL